VFQRLIDGEGQGFVYGQNRHFRTRGTNPESGKKRIELSGNPLAAAAKQPVLQAPGKPG
jgi:hypothetical protein